MVGRNNKQVTDGPLCGAPFKVHDRNPFRQSIIQPATTFTLDHTSDAMINAFIPPQAKLTVDRCRSPKNGDIVVAVMNGRYTVKFLRINDHRRWLVSANKKYPDIEIQERSNVQIAGVVTSIVLDAGHLTRYMM